MSRNYFRLTSDEDIARFVLEWQRQALLKMKAECEAAGMTLKELKIANGTWEQFTASCRQDGEDPDVRINRLQEKVNRIEDQAGSGPVQQTS